MALLAHAAHAPGIRQAARDLRRNIRPRGRDFIDARRLARVDLDEIRRLAQEIAQRFTALLLRLTSSPPDTAAELRRRIRIAARQPSRSPVAIASTTDDEAPAYRPRLGMKGKTT